MLQVRNYLNSIFYKVSFIAIFCGRIFMMKKKVAQHFSENDNIIIIKSHIFSTSKKLHSQEYKAGTQEFANKTKTRTTQDKQ